MSNFYDYLYPNDAFEVDPSLPTEIVPKGKKELLTRLNKIIDFVKQHPMWETLGNTYGHTTGAGNNGFELTIIKFESKLPNWQRSVATNYSEKKGIIEINPNLLTSPHTFTDEQFSQLVFFEIGNLIRNDEFENVDTITWDKVRSWQKSKGNEKQLKVIEEYYVAENANIEFPIRAEIIAACNNNLFKQCIFTTTITDLTEFLNSSDSDNYKDHYRQEFNNNFVDVRQIK